MVTINSYLKRYIYARFNSVLSEKFLLMHTIQLQKFNVDGLAIHELINQNFSCLKIAIFSDCFNRMTVYAAETL